MPNSIFAYLIVTHNRHIPGGFNEKSKTLFLKSEENVKCKTLSLISSLALTFYSAGCILVHFGILPRDRTNPPAFKRSLLMFNSCFLTANNVGYNKFTNNVGFVWHLVAPFLRQVSKVDLSGFVFIFNDGIQSASHQFVHSLV